MVRVSRAVAMAVFAAPRLPYGPRTSGSPRSSVCSASTTTHVPDCGSIVNRSSRVCQRPPPSRLRDSSLSVALAMVSTIRRRRPRRPNGRRYDQATSATLDGSRHALDRCRPGTRGLDGSGSGQGLGGREDLPAPGECRDARGDVDRRAAVVGPAPVGLGRVEADPNGQGEAGAVPVIDAGPAGWRRRSRCRSGPSRRPRRSRRRWS